MEDIDEISLRNLTISTESTLLTSQIQCASISSDVSERKSRRGRNKKESAKKVTKKECESGEDTRKECESGEDTRKECESGEGTRKECELVEELSPEASESIECAMGNSRPSRNKNNKKKKAKIPKQEFVVSCPHCQMCIQILSVRCGIFRHGVFIKSGKQIPPHCKIELCESYVRDGLIYGCGKPFRVSFNEESEEYNAVECDYI